jgi:hypothetical protein
LNSGRWPWGITQDERPIIILTLQPKNKIAATRGKLEVGSPRLKGRACDQAISAEQHSGE